MPKTDSQIYTPGADGLYHCTIKGCEQLPGYKMRQHLGLHRFHKHGIEGASRSTHQPKNPTAMSHSRIVRAYLAHIQSGTPKRRGRSAKELQDALIATTDPIERLKLRPLLREALEAESEDNVNLEKHFIQVCLGFSEENGLSYGDWREEGVAPAVLREAGLRRHS